MSGSVMPLKTTIHSLVRTQVIKQLTNIEARESVLKRVSR